MKRYLLLGVCVLFLGSLVISLHGFPGTICSRSYAERELLAPFEKAREMALASGKMTLNGCNEWIAEFNQNGTKIKFVIVYCEIDGSMCLIAEDEKEMRAVCLNPTRNEFVVFVGFGFTPIPREEAIKIGFQFFRQLVKYNLI